MTKILIDKEIVELAREVIQDYVDEYGPHEKDSGSAYTLMKLDQALEQSTEQEPVGEVANERGDVDWISFVPPTGTELYIEPQEAAPRNEMEATERQVEILTDELAKAQRRIEQLEQSTEQEPESGDYALGYSIGFGEGHEAAKTSPPQPQEAVPTEPLTLETVYETIIYWDEGGGKRSRRELARRIVDLYTQPQEAAPRKPLTDEQLHGLFDSPMTPTGIEFARAIEAAHGITGEKE